MKTYQFLEPYKTPTLVSVETQARCNRACVFCPQHDAGRPDGELDLVTIKAVIDQLAEMKFSGRFAPYIYNEPLRDPRLKDIIAYAREKLPRACIMISTNGDYLRSADQIIDLYVAGLNQMAINVYSAADGDPDPKKVARGIAVAEKRFATLQAMVDEIEDLSQVGSLYGKVSPDACIARVLKKFGVTKDGSGFGGGFELQNRSGLVPWLADRIPPEPLEKTCTRPFRTLQINWRGDVILCCNDFHGNHPFGNVKKERLIDIWSSRRLYEYRLKLLHKDRRLPLCETCDFSGGAYPHMITPVTTGDPKEDARIIATDMRRPTSLTVEGKRV